MFVTKARAQPNEVPLRFSTLAKLANTRLGWKCLQGTKHMFSQPIRKLGLNSGLWTHLAKLSIGP